MTSSDTDNCRVTAGATSQDAVPGDVAGQEGRGLVAVVALLERRDRPERFFDGLGWVARIGRGRQVPVVRHVLAGALDQPVEALALQFDQGLATLRHPRHHRNPF